MDGRGENWETQIGRNGERPTLERWGQVALALALSPGGQRAAVVGGQQGDDLVPPPPLLS